MHPHPNTQQLILIFGGAVFVICFIILGIYAIQKVLHRAQMSDEPKTAKVRIKDEAAFTTETMKAVITQLKAEQKASQDKLVAAEQRADENARKFELIAREIDQGLIIFDGEGFITFTNARVRKVLAVDTWSRRRYTEVFHSIPKLAELLAACLETGKEVRDHRVEFQAWDETNRAIEISVHLLRDQVGALQAIVCLFREVAAEGPAGQQADEQLGR